MSANLEDWWQWRRNKDERDRQQDNELAEHATEIAVIKATQRIREANDEARHAKQPQVVYWIISGLISLTALLLQLWAMGGRIATP